MAYQPIENYAIIGDLHTVALVGIDGSIDFLCFPHFDSPSVFAAMLDDKRGGRFQIAPVMQADRHKQLYLPETNVLLTRFLFTQGVAEVSDFMPVLESGNIHKVVRRVKTVRGEMQLRMICEPRFNYARSEHSVEYNQKRGEVLFTSRGPDKTVLRLRTNVPLKISNGAATAEFTLHTLETATFVLETVHAGEESDAGSFDYVPHAFKETVNYWRRWINRTDYHGRWRGMVDRSALTLKLLTSKPHGSIVAAPTFSLPEEIGGERNWDYRYTWIRDASFTLYALMRLGLHDEAHDFMGWIEARCAEPNPDGSLQIMYGIDGRHKLTEESLTHLEGYRNSNPVRIGNGAYDHLQLDIYGELIDAVYLFNKYVEPIHHDLWESLTRLVDWVCSNWRRKDEGIWEVRGGQQEFLYSRVMCWVALDRAIQVAQHRSLPAPLDRWYQCRNEIYREIMSQFWEPQRRVFVQYRGGNALDASNLLMPMVKFISPTDPRWLSTLAAIEQDLVDDSLVFRYRTTTAASDGLAGEEGTFTMCSFWFVECLARAGDVEKSRFLFEKMLGYANHAGLYAEELGPCGEHLGNFPQAFTHLALISAAFNLDGAISKRAKAGSIY